MTTEPASASSFIARWQGVTASELSTVPGAHNRNHEQDPRGDSISLLVPTHATEVWTVVRALATAVYASPTFQILRANVAAAKGDARNKTLVKMKRGP